MSHRRKIQRIREGEKWILRGVLLQVGVASHAGIRYSHDAVEQVFESMRDSISEKLCYFGPPALLNVVGTLESVSFDGITLSCDVVLLDVPLAAALKSEEEGPSWAFTLVCKGVFDGTSVVSAEFVHFDVVPLAWVAT